METLQAFLTVGGAWAGWLLIWRRVRVARGRRAGPAIEAVGRYDHVALAEELVPLLQGDDTRADGARRVEPAGGMIGSLPGAWADAPWAFERPDRLADARDALLAGEAELAADRAAGAPRPSIHSLFVWAFLHHLFSGELAFAEATIAGLRRADPEAGRLAHRLEARLQVVRAELAPPGLARESACSAGARALRAAAVSARRGAGPAEAGLLAHFQVLRLSFWDLELREVAARRHLRRALVHHPQAAVLHLVLAHLEAMLGAGEDATDHLARALYYARGDRFYARPIAASPWIARMRPALAAEARGILEEPEASRPGVPSCD